MIVGLLRHWYGNFTRQELKKYLLLGLTFALILGIYWTLRPLKDGIFGAFIIGYGKQNGGIPAQAYLAWAKVVSLIMLFPLVLIYSKMVDLFHRHRIFYIIGILYALGLLGWALFFSLPSVGLANTVASPWRISGWLWYVFVESFGSIVIALFWAFVTDITDSTSAKRSFPLLYIIGQFGGIILPPALTKMPRYCNCSSWIIVAACAGCLFAVVLLIYYFMQTTPQHLMIGYQPTHTDQESTKTEPGFLEGLRLLFSHGYLIGIFALLSFFELITTIIDFNFKTMAFASHSCVNAVNEYLGVYATWVNIAAFTCLLLGINNITRWLGIRTSLVLIPLMIGSAFALFFMHPHLDTLFYITVGAKALNYSLNGPSIKQLYVPTTEQVKYKSQAWIETFGSRSSKCTASLLNISKSVIGSQAYFMLIALISTSIIAGWLGIALYLAHTYTKAIDKKRVVC